MPSIYEFLGLLDFLRGYPAAYIVLITATVILIVRDWRWSILALLIQYLIVGLLFADVISPNLAFMKVVVGVFVCLILYITARQVKWGRIPEDVTEEEVVLLEDKRLASLGPFMLSTDTPFRVFLALLVGIAIWALVQRLGFQLPVAPTHISLTVFAMSGMGLITLSLTSEPLKAGMGLLTFLTGFELFYSAVESSIALVAVWAVADLVVALVIAYLIQARHSYWVLLD